MPLAPAASLPGTFFHPEPVCHSHSSPFFSPSSMRSRASGVMLRARKFVAMNPPSGRPRTELRPIGSGAMAQPIQVTAGVAGRVSISKTSTDSRVPWPTTKSVWTVPVPGCSHRPCVVNLAFGPLSGGPGQSPVFLFVRALARRRGWIGAVALTVADANQIDTGSGIRRCHDPLIARHHHEIFGRLLVADELETGGARGGAVGHGRRRGRRLRDERSAASASSPTMATTNRARMQAP